MAFAELNEDTVQEAFGDALFRPKLTPRLNKSSAVVERQSELEELEWIMLMNSKIMPLNARAEKNILSKIQRLEDREIQRAVFDAYIDIRLGHGKDIQEEDEKSNLYSKVVSKADFGATVFLNIGLLISLVFSVVAFFNEEYSRGVIFVMLLVVIMMYKRSRA